VIPAPGRPPHRLDAPRLRSHTAACDARPCISALNLFAISHNLFQHDLIRPSLAATAAVAAVASAPPPDTKLDDETTMLLPVVLSCPGPRPKISLGCLPRAARRIFATIVWSSLPGLSSWLPWLSRRPAAFAPFPQMMHRNCGTRVCAQQHDCHMAPPPPVSPATLARPSTSTIWGAEDTPPSPRLAHHHWGRGHDMPPSPPPLAVSIRCHRRQSNWQPPAAASNAARVTCCRSVRVRPGPSPVVFLPVHYGSCRLASRCPRPWRSPTCSSGRRHNA
jgi:hypothetical protein